MFKVTPNPPETEEPKRGQIYFLSFPSNKSFPFSLF